MICLRKPGRWRRRYQKLEIPTVWFRGTGKEDFPDEPLRGVRLLILDLVLNPPNFDANWAAGAVYSTVAATYVSGPLILILWTSHPDDRINFELSLNKYNSDLPPQEKVLPIAIIDAHKGQYMANKSPGNNNINKFEIDKIISKVNDVLGDLSPFNELLEWEAACSDASSATINIISTLALSLSDLDIGLWRTGTKGLMNSLAEASGGKDAIQEEVPEMYRSALYESLAMIQEDAVRSLSRLQDVSLVQPFIQLADIQERTATAALNSILLTAYALSSDIPGTVLCMQTANIDNMPFLAENTNKEYRRFVANFFGPKYPPNKKVILSSCKPVLIEVSPSCDYAQQKRKRLRFAVGLLIPSELDEHLLNSAEYIKKIGPIIYNSNILYLAIDSLHFFSSPINIELPIPLFRLRSHVLVDIQSWLGGHLSRPGHLHL